ncbi:unnamed protein product [Lymnaea stagnalis]|uniref:Uncharacterized protein n=1 Tax=Lymnaea stagnalis TaxID=6523 RepID=A0AAV2IDU4_LYMST
MGDVVKGDGLDNDCDGLIDEEIKDLQDNDMDGHIDEDLSPPIRGEWGEWQSWTCLQNCKGSTATRHRYCNDPIPEAKGMYCQGNSKESRRNYCNTGLACPEDCPEKTFGLGCQMSCENCRTDCSKIQGTCLECEPGFRMPHNFCMTECPTGTYGLHCAGNCMFKCGEDCYERIQGNCFEHSETEYDKEFSVRDFTQFFPLIVSIMPLAVLFAVYRRAERERRVRLKSVAYLEYRRRTRRNTTSRGERRRSRRSTRTRLSMTQGTSHGRERTSLRDPVTFKDTPKRESVTFKDTPKRESVTFKDTPTRDSATFKGTPVSESATFKDTPKRESVTFKDTPKRESVTFKDTPKSESVTSEGSPILAPVAIVRQSISMKKVHLKTDCGLMDGVLMDRGSMLGSSVLRGSVISDNITESTQSIQSTDLKSDNSRKNDILKMNDTEIKKEKVLWDQVTNKDFKVATIDLYGSDII